MKVGSIFEIDWDSIENLNGSHHEEKITKIYLIRWMMKFDQILVNKEDQPSDNGWQFVMKSNKIIEKVFVWWGQMVQILINH